MPLILLVVNYGKSVESVDRSMAATPTSFFSSRARLQSSANLITTIAQERPLRKHYILGEKVCAKEVYS